MNSQTEDVNLQAGASSWVGLEMGDYLIERQIGEGAFSWVYLGFKPSDRSCKVFKVAKPQELVGTIGSTCFFPTQALTQITGSFATIKLDAAELLSQQAQMLQSVGHKNLVGVDKFERNGTLCYYQCEYFEGETLRQSIDAKEATLSTLIDLARALDGLSKVSSFRYHGDLKPDNIILTKSGIKLIDPGYFGDVTHNGQPAGHAAVTTPAYYPFLEADDLFAFGVIAWEVLTGEHPFPAKTSSGQIDTTEVAPELLTWIETNEAVGNYFTSGLLALKNPADSRSDIPQALGKLLLQLLRLRVTNQGKLAQDPGFRSFGAISGALLSVS